MHEGEEAQSHESGLDDSKDGIVRGRQCAFGVHFQSGVQEGGGQAFD